MKELTKDYVDLEESTTKHPVELFKFWTADAAWYYTNSDVDIVFDGNTYVSAPIARGVLVQNEDPASVTCTISISRLNTVGLQYISSNPMETVRVMVYRIHRYQDPIEGEVKFAGFVDAPVLKGSTVQLKCASIAKWLDQSIPTYRIQPLCNAVLFDSQCQLLAADFQTDGTVAFANASGTILVADAFDTQADGYFNLGHVLINGHRRMITQHIGTSVTLRYPIPIPTVGDSFSAWPGCDGSIATCLAKFNNKDNHRGYPDMPLDNPTLWV